MSENKLYPRLIVLCGGEKKGQSYVIESNSFTIGRSADNDVVFDNATVSSNHCRIYEDEEGNHWVSDSESTNGTLHNKTRISEPEILKSGDILKLGSIEILFESDVEKQIDIKTILSISEDTIGVDEIKNLSPFAHTRKDERKINRIFLIVLVILGLLSFCSLFLMMKSLVVM